MRVFPLVVLMLGLAVSPSAAGFRSYGQVTEIRDGQQSFAAPYDISGAVQAGDGRALGSGGGGNPRAQASSPAHIGGLRANAFAEIREQTTNQTLGANISRSGIAVAIGTYEVTITGPSGPVMTSFDMELGGTLFATSGNTAADANAAGSGVDIVFRVDGVVLTPGQNPLSSGDYSISTVGGGPLQTITFGALDDWAPPVDKITSLPFTVQAGTPFTLEITLNVGAFANANAAESAFIASGNADFGSTLRFPTGAPIFHLPAGYAVNAPDAGIVDNQVPCVANCTQPGSKCDAGKLGC